MNERTWRSLFARQVHSLSLFARQVHSLSLFAPRTRRLEVKRTFLQAKSRNLQAKAKSRNLQAKGPGGWRSNALFFSCLFLGQTHTALLSKSKKRSPLLSKSTHKGQTQIEKKKNKRKVQGSNTDRKEEERIKRKVSIWEKEPKEKCLSERKNQQKKRRDKRNVGWEKEDLESRGHLGDGRRRETLNPKP